MTEVARARQGGNLGGLAGSEIEVPVDEEDLEIRILLILSPRHSDIRIHSDEQVHNTNVVVCH